MKLELLTNATVVNDAIRFIAGKSNNKAKCHSSDGDEHKEESNKPDYYEDQLEQEEEPREIRSNHVF